MTIIMLLIITVVLFILIILLGFLYFKTTEKYNILLKDSKSKDQVYKMISHDLKSPLSALEQIVPIIKDFIDANDKEKAKELLGYCGVSINEINRLTISTLDWLWYDSGNKEKMHFTEVLLRVKSFMMVSAEAKNINLIIDPFDINGEADDRYVVYGYETQVVIRNLISNIIKHTDATTVTMGIKHYGNSWYLNLNDNARPMSDSEFLEISQLGSYLSVISTQKRSGLGLILISNFLKKANMNLEVIRRSDGNTFKLFNKA